MRFNRTIRVHRERKTNAWHLCGDAQLRRHSTAQWSQCDRARPLSPPLLLPPPCACVYFRFSTERFRCAVAVVRRLVRPRLFSSGGCCWRARISLFELEKLNGRPDQTEDTRSPWPACAEPLSNFPSVVLLLRKSRRKCSICEVQTDRQSRKSIR